MNKKILQCMWFLLGLFPIVSNGKLNENRVYRETFFNDYNFPVKQDSVFLHLPLNKAKGLTHRHEINWCIYEMGIQAMPKMNNYHALPTFSGIGYSFRPTKPNGYQFKPHFFLQFYATLSNYDFKSSREGKELKHTMVFDNGSESIIGIRYTNHISQYLTGFKFNIYEKEMNNNNRYLRPFIEGNIGFAHIRTRMVIPDPEQGWDDCIPLLDDRFIVKNTGGIFRSGLGLEIGNYDRTTFYYVKIGYLGSFKPFEYANQNFLDNKPRTAIHDSNNHQQHHQHHQQEGVRDFHVDFINVFNSDVHSHKVSEIYYSHLRFIYINFGVNIAL